MVRANFNKDGSVSLNFRSGQEISDDKVMYLVNAARRDELGWICWSPNEIQTDDLPKEQAEENQKTEAQMLRATIYVWWQQQGGKGDYEVFYRQQMGKLRDMVKSKLD